MNKLTIGLLLAASLFVMDVTPAAAHENGYREYRYAEQHRMETRRRTDMPRWLKRDRTFRHWYRHTPLKHYRFISWRQMYDIYRWERSYFADRRHRQYRY